MHHPWRDLREREHLTIEWGHLPPGLRGATAGDTIWMESRLLQVERRCTLTHELVHIDFGHEGCQTEKEEERVRKVTAERLIRRDHLIHAFRWALSLEEAADELWVTPEVLLDRLRFMHPSERLLVAGAVQAGREHHAD